MALTFSLDDCEALKPSVESKVELNNFMVKMRKAVNKGKELVHHNLVKLIKKLSKKSTKHEKEKLKNGKKIQARQNELDILQKIDKDRLCKLILANELTLNELGKSSIAEAESYVVARLGEVPYISKVVCLFRSEHPDWRDLVHFLLYKNSNGRWKSFEQKLRCSRREGCLPLPPGPSKWADDDDDETDIKLYDEQIDLEDQKAEQEQLITTEVSHIKQSVDKETSKSDNYVPNRKSNDFKKDEEKNSNEISGSDNGNTSDDDDDDDDDDGDNVQRLEDELSHNADAEENSDDDKEDSDDDDKEDSDADNSDSDEDSECSDNADGLAIVSDDEQDNNSDSENEVLGTDDIDIFEKKRRKFADRKFESSKGSSLRGRGGSNQRMRGTSHFDQSQSNYADKRSGRSSLHRGHDRGRGVQKRGHDRGRGLPSRGQDKARGHDGVQTANSSASLHPSWQAKMEQKRKMKIDLSSQLLAKKIKFTDD